VLACYSQMRQPEAVWTRWRQCELITTGWVSLELWLNKGRTGIVTCWVLQSACFRLRALTWIFFNVIFSTLLYKNPHICVIGPCSSKTNILFQLHFEKYVLFVSNGKTKQQRDFCLGFVAWQKFKWYFNFQLSAFNFKQWPT